MRNPRRSTLRAAASWSATIAPDTGGHSVMVRVTNADQHFKAARLAGAKVASEPMSYPYGERQYSVADLAGHVWTFSQTEANVEPSAWGGQLINAGNNPA